MSIPEFGPSFAGPTGPLLPWGGSGKLVIPCARMHCEYSNPRDRPDVPDDPERPDGAVVVVAPATPGLREGPTPHAAAPAATTRRVAAAKLRRVQGLRVDVMPSVLCRFTWLGFMGQVYEMAGDSWETVVTWLLPVIWHHANERPSPRWGR